MKADKSGSSGLPCMWTGNMAISLSGCVWTHSGAPGMLSTGCVPSCNELFAKACSHCLHSHSRHQSGMF